MKRLFTTTVLVIAALSSGCSTASYNKYADSTVAMEKEESVEYTTKIEALTAIAIDAKSTEVTRSSALMAIAMIPKGKKRELVAPKDPLELGVSVLQIGAQAYSGWLGFLLNTNNSTKGAANTDIARQTLEAGTVHFNLTQESKSK